MSADLRTILKSLKSTLEADGPAVSHYLPYIEAALTADLVSAQPIGALCTGCGSSMDDEQLREKREGNPNLISCCPERSMVPVYAKPPAPQPTEVDGIEKAAKYIDQQISDYVQEFGSYDPSTGHTEYSEAGHEYLSTLEELADSIRALTGGEA